MLPYADVCCFRLWWCVASWRTCVSKFLHSIDLPDTRDTRPLRGNASARTAAVIFSSCKRNFRVLYGVEKKKNFARVTEFYSWEYWISTWIQTFKRRGGRQPTNRRSTDFDSVYKKVTVTDFWDWTLMRSLLSTLNRKWLENSEVIVGRRSLSYIRRCVSRPRSRSLGQRHARRG